MCFQDNLRPLLSSFASPSQFNAFSCTSYKNAQSESILSSVAAATITTDNLNFQTNSESPSSIVYASEASGSNIYTTEIIALSTKMTTMDKLTNAVFGATSITLTNSDKELTNATVVLSGIFYSFRSYYSYTIH